MMQQQPPKGKEMGRRRIVCMLEIIIILVTSCCWGVIVQAEYIIYKDPNHPTSVRVNDLLNRMTLEEKIGQMTQIERKNASFEVIKNFFIGKQMYHCIYFYAFFMLIMC